MKCFINYQLSPTVVTALSHGSSQRCGTVRYLARRAIKAAAIRESVLLGDAVVHTSLLRNSCSQISASFLSPEEKHS